MARSLGSAVAVCCVLGATADMGQWLQRNLVDDEGRELKEMKSVTASECERECESMIACHSFSFSPSSNHCHLKDKCVTASDRHRWNHDYMTYYQPCVTPTPTPTPAPTSSAPPTAPHVSTGTTWAVIAVGSSGFSNYRHQSDGCHAYHVLRKRGIPADQIIVMMQDDVANSEENPFPGKLYNRPGSGLNVTDVYEGCKVDYRGSIVTAKLFLSVITGDESGVPANGKVLRSTSSDRVFLNFVDHGGVNIVAFPNGPTLHSSELATALKTMKSKNMYSEVLFYMEACESGSMFPDLAADSRILAVTAANARESSWGYYCMPNDKVNGKHIGSCLGDLFSISWMEDSDLSDLQESIATQVKRVITRTSKSHVMTFGDTSFENERYSNFELRSNPAFDSMMSASEDGAWDVRDIPMQTAYYQWEAEKDVWRKKAAFEKLQQVIAGRVEDEKLFAKVAASVCTGMPSGCSDDLQKQRHNSKDLGCHYDLVNVVHHVCPKRAGHNPGGWNAFNMRFSQMLVNICEKRRELDHHMDSLKQIIHAECAVSATSWQVMTVSVSDSEIVV